MTCHKFELQPHDELILAALAYHVVMFLPLHLMEWFGVDESRISGRLSRLRKAAYVAAHQVRIKLLREVLRLGAWSPNSGAPHPDAGAISYAAKKRWKTLSLQTQTAYVATERTLSHFGLAARKPFRTDHAQHDALTTSVWLHMMHRWPTLTWNCWQGEGLYEAEALKQRFVKVPDARLVHRHRREQVMLVVETAGSYRKDRVESFQREMDQLQVPYWMF